MDLPLKPIYLFADSQMLFWKDDGLLFLDLIRARVEGPSPRAAYIGASNGDQPEFYDIFKEAMQSIMIRDCRMILSSYGPEDSSFINEADIILLAGGDAKMGWDIFQRTGMNKDIIKRYSEGAVLIGISAGAVQLGMIGHSGDGVFEALKLVPFVIGAHEEKTEWEGLQRIVEKSSWNIEGAGIPTGGGAIYHQDNTLEAIRHPISTFYKRDGKTVPSLVMPRASSGELISSEIN